MKRFVNFWCDWLSPISLIVGTIALAMLTFSICILSENPWACLLASVVYFSYGYCACDVIIPFFKRLSARRREKRNKEASA